MDSFLDNNIHTLNKNNHLNIYITNYTDFNYNIMLSEEKILDILKYYNTYKARDNNYIDYKYDNCSIQVNKKENCYYSKETITSISANLNNINILGCIFKYNLLNENLITHSNFSSIEKKQSKIFNLGNFELIIDYFETNQYFTVRFVIKKPVEKKIILSEIETICNLIN